MNSIKSFYTSAGQSIIYPFCEKSRIVTPLYTCEKETRKLYEIHYSLLKVSTFVKRRILQRNTTGLFSYQFSLDYNTRRETLEMQICTVHLYPRPHITSTKQSITILTINAVLSYPWVYIKRWTLPIIRYIFNMQCVRKLAGCDIRTSLGDFVANILRM